MRVAIIEDEIRASDHLTSLIERIDPDARVVAILDSVKESLRWLAKNDTPDLVFMDIQLGDGLSFEIFEVVDLEAPIIFTTAYDEYAIKAFKVNSIDYLLKPIDEAELRAAIEKYQTLGEKRQPQALPDLKQVVDLLSNQYKSRFVVKIGEHIKSIPTEDIEYFFSREKATFFAAKDKRNYLIDFALDRIEDLLDPKEFYRVNRKFIIRHEAIDDIISYSNSRLRLILTNPPTEEVIVSRDRVSGFRTWLDQ